VLPYIEQRGRKSSELIVSITAKLQKFRGLVSTSLKTYHLLTAVAVVGFYNPIEIINYWTDGTIEEFFLAINIFKYNLVSATIS